jgi:hypothetical protein
MVRVADGETDSNVIDAGDMTAGVTMAQWFAGEASRIYDLFHQSGADQESVELWEKLRALGGKVTARDLMRHGKYKTAKPAREALEDLVKRGWATRQVLEPGVKGGRPSTTYTLVKAIDTSMTEPNRDPSGGSDKGVLSVESIVSSGIPANRTGVAPDANADTNTGTDN